MAERLPDDQLARLLTGLRQEVEARPRSWALPVLGETLLVLLDEAERYREGDEVGQPEPSPRRFRCSECSFDSDEDHMVRVERQRWVCNDCVSNLLDEIERLNGVTGELREYADRLDDPVTRGIGARLREIANRTAQKDGTDA